MTAIGDERRPVRPRPAASLVALRHRAGALEVLMGRRSATARFMPGFYVCPGGRVAPEDMRPWAGEAETAPEVGLPFARLPLPRAALRETYEETGLLLGRQGAAVAPPKRVSAIEQAYRTHEVVPALDLVRFIGRAITPTTSPIRFDTHFFLADGQHLVGSMADSNELDDVDWHPAAPDSARKMSGVTRFMLARAIEVWAGTAESPPLFRYVGGRVRITR